MYTLGNVTVWFMIATLIGCASQPYKVCGKSGCTEPMTHDEAINASQVKKAWGEGLYIDVNEYRR